MNFTIEKTIELLKGDKFVKIRNVNDFSELSANTKNILKNYGLPSSQFGSYPRMVTDGHLKMFKNGLIEIAVSPAVLDKYCIDSKANERLILYDLSKDLTYDTNSSLQKFFECKYAVAWYYENIEFKEKFGVYGDNHEKYANVLRDMLNKIEPGIQNFPIWESLLTEKELGVI